VWNCNSKPGSVILARISGFQETLDAIFACSVHDSADGSRLPRMSSEGPIQAAGLNHSLEDAWHSRRRVKSRPEAVYMPYRGVASVADATPSSLSCVSSHVEAMTFARKNLG
jgi:hypothetical protein